MAVRSGAFLAAMVMASPLWAATLELDAKLLKATPTPTQRQIAPYPRALCTYLYEVQKVHRGSYDEKKILVVKWAVWGRTPLKGLPSKVGSVERLDLDRWIDYPGFTRQRVVDGVGEKELVIYYDFRSQPKSGLDEVLKEKEDELASGVVKGAAEGWLFLAEELSHVATGRFWEKDWKEVSRAGVDPLPAMLDFQKRLKALGVGLLVVPVPTKVEIYWELLGNIEFAPQSEYVGELRKAGLEVLDVAPVLADDRYRGFGTYCEQDSHWSSLGCALVGESIRKRLGIAEAALREGVELVGGEREIRGDLAGMLPDEAIPPERMLVNGLEFTEAGRKLGHTHPESSVVLLGDSHVTVFSGGEVDLHGSGAGLPDQLFLKFGFPVDVIASNGDGVNQARVNLYQERSINPKFPNYWENKKWVIWVFAAREFTRAEKWSTKIPVVRGR